MEQPVTLKHDVWDLRDMRDALQTAEALFADAKTFCSSTKRLQSHGGGKALFELTKTLKEMHLIQMHAAVAHVKRNLQLPTMPGRLPFELDGLGMPMDLNDCVRQQIYEIMCRSSEKNGYAPAEAVPPLAELERHRVDFWGPTRNMDTTESACADILEYGVKTVQDATWNDMCNHVKNERRCAPPSSRVFNPMDLLSPVAGDRTPSDAFYDEWMCYTPLEDIGAEKGGAIELGKQLQWLNKKACELFWASGEQHVSLCLLFDDLSVPPPRMAQLVARVQQLLSVVDVLHHGFPIAGTKKSVKPKGLLHEIFQNSEAADTIQNNLYKLRDTAQKHIDAYVGVCEKYVPSFWNHASWAPRYQDRKLFLLARTHVETVRQRLWRTLVLAASKAVSESAIARTAINFLRSDAAADNFQLPSDENLNMALALNAQSTQLQQSVAYQQWLEVLEEYVNRLDGANRAQRDLLELSVASNEGPI